MHQRKKLGFLWLLFHYAFRLHLHLLGFETDSKYVIAMEYVPGGELFDHVWEKQGMSEEDAKEMFAQIVEAVHHCHKVSNIIIHNYI